MQVASCEKVRSFQFLLIFFQQKQYCFPCYVLIHTSYYYLFLGVRVESSKYNTSNCVNSNRCSFSFSWRRKGTRYIPLHFFAINNHQVYSNFLRTAKIVQNNEIEKQARYINITSHKDAMPEYVLTVAS